MNAASGFVLYVFPKIIFEISTKEFKEDII